MMGKKVTDKKSHKLEPVRVLNLYRQLSHHVRPLRWLMAGAGLSMIGVTVVELLKPWPIKIIFDGILMPGQRGGWLLDYISLWGFAPQTLLACMVGAIFALAALTGLFSYGQTYFLAVAGQRVMTSIRLELYGHIQKLSLNFHDEHTGRADDARVPRQLWHVDVGAQHGCAGIASGHAVDGLAIGVGRHGNSADSGLHLMVLRGPDQDCVPAVAQA
jgi:ABC-type multidrug transport system fused ATPase/permease subunit